MKTPLVIPGTKPDCRIGFTLVHGLYTSKESGWDAAVYAWGQAHTYADWSFLRYTERVLGIGHDQHLAMLTDLLRGELSEFAYNGQQHAVGHSNGARLLMECLLRNPAMHLDDLHLIAAWWHRDCRKHLNTIIQRGQVKRVFCYVSKRDDVLGWNWGWPGYWGWTLGKDGPQNAFPTPQENPVGLLEDDDPYVFQVGRDDTQKHCSWVDARDDTDDPGFNLATFSKILHLSAPTVAIADSWASNN